MTDPVDTNTGAITRTPDGANATYRNHPGHAEAVEIVFDPTVTTYRDILAFFFQIHDPSTLNRQGNDVGTRRWGAWPCCRAPRSCGRSLTTLLWRPRAPS